MTNHLMNDNKLFGNNKSLWIQILITDLDTKNKVHTKPRKSQIIQSIAVRFLSNYKGLGKVGCQRHPLCIGVGWLLQTLPLKFTF